MDNSENKTLTAYDNALGFANAFRLLFCKTSIPALQKSGSYSDTSMIMPTFVNGAFACELFLKALLKKPPTKGKNAHSLLALIDQYENEHPGKKGNIKQSCIDLMHNVKQNYYYDTSSYERDLGTLDNAFYELRYWHEPVSPDDPKRDRVYSLGFLEVLVVVLQGECEGVYGKRPIQTNN